MARLSNIVPRSLSTRLARYAVPIAIGAVALLLLVGIAAAALLSPGTLGIQAARVAQTTPLDNVAASSLKEKDTDHDGVSDALENYVYGTDVANWNSSGTGIPDGWLVQYGYDPLDPNVANAHGHAPPAEKLPAVYASGYPLAYTPPLSVYYDYAKPADYRPGVDAPWWLKGDHADPVAIDQTGTGIPTGWLLAHHVPLHDLNPDVVAPGSKGNMTIRQAFEANTDPYEADSDHDGIDDWTEIHVTHTDPSKFSTAGSGIADGWLLHYHLSLTDPNVGTQDPDRDGLTNFEEFNLSASTFHPADITELFKKGLDPNNWETAGTGIPDGWYVRYGLSPFGTDVDRVLCKASDFAEYRTWTPEGQPPLPDITFTVRGAYEYARPSDWNESAKGVWWGGTNPATCDSDADGLPDPVEIRGWYANVTFDTGPEAKARVYHATSNPLEPDSDGDGLTDVEEYRGQTDCGEKTLRTFPPTDPRNRDTAFSLLSDYEKVCGVVRGDIKYDLGPKNGTAGLDPTKADSAGDHIKDGTRVDFWHDRYQQLRENPRYPYNGSAYKTVFDWTGKYARFNGLSKDQVLSQFRPDGDVDNDGILNVVDADPSGGLYGDRFGEPGAPRTKVYFLGGPQIDPTAYRLTEFASPVPHPATDPANPDTDGDNLPDSWEIRYGKFDPAKGVWDLDPAHADSDGNGITDDKENNDGDIITWYSFDRHGATTERTTHTFAFTNELEFKAGTDPDTLSTAGDGVPDGWKAFWGSRITSGTYPNLLGSRDASIGSVAIEHASDLDAALAASPITPVADLKDMGAKITGYVRFVNVSACPVADPTPLLRVGERVADTNGCFSGTNLDDQPIKLLRVYGAKKLSYADEARFHTNPYMDDTDGDGAPDAYEAYYAQRTAAGSLYPDPVADDRAKDPDGDGLSIDQECGSTDGKQCGFETFRFEDQTVGAGADPNNADTDGDGIQDGIEAGALFDPLDASDVENFARADKDTDFDGVPDFQELTGKDAKIFFGDAIRTNPKDPDTDGDGLLDGETVNLNPTTQSALVANWTARGIAHKTLANGSIDFLGERTFGPAFGLRPDKIDSGVAGIPDGWLAYYNQNPKEHAIDPAPYNAHKPSWWNEQIDGVWWWGEVPGATSVDDLDGDGLNDHNGEDPFPAINRVNQVHDGNVTITDMSDLEAWVKAGGAADGQRHRAQMIGDGAGDPSSARAAAADLVDPSGVYARNMRACVAILNVVAPSTIDKGVAFNVTGRVVLNERASGVCGAGGGSLLEGSESARIGLANRTVLVSVLSPTAERVVGAGFTDAQGAFNVRTNVTATQTFPIPAKGLALLGATNGSVTQRFDPSQLATGATTGSDANTLIVWVYNTSTAARPGDPTYAVHQARVADRSGAAQTVSVNATSFATSTPQPITVRAGTQLQLNVPDTAVNGGNLQGEIKLLDTSGAPLFDKTVIVRWSGSTSPIELRNLSTDREGTINLTRVGIPVGARTPDAYTLTANFSSSDPNLLPTQAAAAIHVQTPTALTANASETSATVGQTIDIAGELDAVDVRLPDGSTRAGGPLASAPVSVSIGGASASGVTDPQGRFLVHVEVPGSVAAGQQIASVTYAGTDTTAPTNATVLLDIKRTAELVDLDKVEGPRSIDVLVRGRLVDNEGQGFDGAVEVDNDKAGTLARGLSAQDGTFALVVPLAPLELGTQTLRVEFLGDPTHAPAENLTTARVTSTTRLVIEEAPTVVVRGDAFGFRARLVDDTGAPVASQPVAGYWRGDKSEVIVTDADGRVSFLIRTNASDRPSAASLGVEFTPAANSIFQPSDASASLRVVQGVSLELVNASVARGPISISGHVLDDTHHPLPGAPIEITLDGASLGEARTSRNGTFEIQHVIPPDAALGPHQVVARFTGSDTLANVTTTATWSIRSPLTLDLTTIGPFVRGENAPLEGRLLDDEGAPVDASFHVFLAGRDLGAFRTSSGKLQATLAIPADLPRGTSTLKIAAPLSDKYDALDQELPVVIKIRPKVQVELPTLAVRGFAVGGGVTLLDDQGQPLRNTSYAYVIGSGTSAVIGTTNADGKGALAGVAPIAGDAVLALTVRGGSDVVAAQYSTTSMKVVGPATPIGYAALILALIILLAIIGLVVAAILLRRRQLQEAREILDEAIRDLLAGNEYAGTIFLAYRRFAAYLSRHGFAEKASDTPREFATGVRKALPIGAVALRSLIGLFEEARYSDHPIGSRERDQAVESLAQVRNELDKLLGSKKVSA